jgi:hypothetical protein
MPRGEIRCNCIGKIQEIPLGIEIGIGDPVIKRLDSAFIPPEKLDTLCIAKAIIAVRPFLSKVQFRLNEVMVFLIEDLSPE